MNATNQELTPKAKQEVEQQERTRPGRHFVPEVDIAEDSDALWIWADMPGVTAEQVGVHLDDNTLLLEGRVSLDGDYVRRFTLPDAAHYDRDRIAARLENGVLEVKLPKAEVAKPRKIAVSG